MIVTTGIVVFSRRVVNLRGQAIATACNAQFELINPWLRCEEENLRQREFVGLKEHILAKLNDAENAGLITSVAVYVRDLKNGPWFGIGERDEYAPASLLKIPILMTYLRLAEDDPPLLQRTVMLDQEPLPIAPQSLAAESRLQKGKTYTIAELLDHMIQFSDNTAKEILQYYLSAVINSEEDLIMQTFSDLGMQNITDAASAMTVKLNAALFRILYNASYLNKEMSERALQMLTHTTFNDGIVAGVPSGIRVAHKFGERGDLEQLHDCGIVFHPDHPYLVCIMTKGGSLDFRISMIADISRTVFEEIETDEDEVSNTVPMADVEAE
jgi:beta-lactamase class A